jgi:hypothetical protein
VLKLTKLTEGCYFDIALLCESNVSYEWVTESKEGGGVLLTLFVVGH